MIRLVLRFDGCVVGFDSHYYVQKELGKRMHACVHMCNWHRSKHKRLCVVMRVHNREGGNWFAMYKGGKGIDWGELQHVGLIWPTRQLYHGRCKQLGCVAFSFKKWSHLTKINRRCLEGGWPPTWRWGGERENTGTRDERSRLAPPGVKTKSVVFFFDYYFWIIKSSCCFVTFLCCLLCS